MQKVTVLIRYNMYLHIYVCDNIIIIVAIIKTTKVITIGSTIFPYFLSLVLSSLVIYDIIRRIA